NRAQPALHLIPRKKIENNIFVFKAADRAIAIDLDLKARWAGQMKRNVARVIHQISARKG
ncbi:MAG: hypothetical protein EB012_12905, partial [Gammaproteobacteria bacterium]|nr:hypothetical protein [Gammaproteobacteria bacterium]NDE56939.1 hypothetical protein [Gammaproteobacteria bacterium]